MPSITERLADVAVAALLSQATVVRVDRLSAHFLRVGLAAPAFRRTESAPGGKLQLRPRPGNLTFRTYTPTRWDSEQGETEIVAYTHGDGPAADWFREVAVGDPCSVFGPRKSIDLATATGRVVFLGDETSIGLACALRTVNPEVTHVFEARDPVETTAVLDRLGLAGDSTVVADRPALLERAARLSGDTPYDLVVTGDAATVHAVRRAVRDWSVPPRSVKGKAYWAEGRTGLD